MVFVVLLLVSFLVLNLAEEEGAGCLAFVLFLLLCVLLFFCVLKMAESRADI